MQPYMGLSLYELIPGGTDAQGSPSLESEWMGGGWERGVQGIRVWDYRERCGSLKAGMHV